MATILEKVKFNPYERQSYTKYELSNMIKEKRSELNLDIEQFSEKYDISTKVILAIEEAKRSFNVIMYKACCRILDMNIDEILRKDSEEQLNISYRKNGSDETDDFANETVELANIIFNEMVMQRKYNVGN